MRLIDAYEAMRQMSNSRKDLRSFANRAGGNDAEWMKRGIDIMYNNARDIVDSLAKLHAYSEINWITVKEKLPETADYVLMSFENFTLPAIGRYEVNDKGDGAWYLGDDDEEETCCSQDLFVNAWMPLLKPYREEKRANQ